jgi:hypothetical protein
MKPSPRVCNVFGSAEMDLLVMAVYKKWKVMDFGMKPLFIEGVIDVEMGKILALIRVGYVSDPPGFPMYYEVNHKPGCELLTWRAIRGNSPLERYAINLHLYKLME